MTSSFNVLSLAAALALSATACSTLDPLEESPFPSSEENCDDTGGTDGGSETDTGTDDTGSDDTGEIEDTGGIDTGSDDTDPCDLIFRAYAEDEHWVDVAVGAMPLVTATGGSTTVDSTSSVFSTSFTVTSKMGCGSVEITGVQVLIERTDGEEIPKADTEENELVDLTIDVSELAPSGWYGATHDSSTAPTIGMDWSSVWSGDEIGEFEAYTLGPNDSREYIVYPEALRSVPAGEYKATYALTWRDIETGTEVWAANLDNATWYITVE